MGRIIYINKRYKGYGKLNDGAYHDSLRIQATRRKLNDQISTLDKYFSSKTV